jgi:hypothetical protein
VLVRQRDARARRPARLAQRALERVRRDAHLARRAHVAGSRRVELGDEERRAALAQVPERRADVLDVVEHVGAEERVEAERGERRPLDVERLERDVRVVRGVEARLEVGERIGVRVDGMDVPGRTGEGRVPEREVAGAAADVGDTGSGARGHEVPVTGRQVAALLLAGPHRRGVSHQKAPSA